MAHAPTADETLPGFDPVAARVLRHLVRHGETDEPAAAGALGLTPAAVRDALGLLERDQLVVRTGDRWAALPPRSGLATLLARRRAELAGWERHIDALDAEYWSAGERREPAGMTEYISGPDQVAAVYAQLLGSATREILHLAKPPYVASPAHPAGSGAHAELAPGLRMRSVYDTSGFDDPVSLHTAVSGSEHGGHLRLLADVPTKLVVVDRRVALLPRDGGDASAGSVVVRVPGIVAALVALFRELWRRATPLELWVPAEVKPGHGPSDGLPGRAREILELMTTGLTDDSIARALGISRRTVQKHVTELAATLGARTRFQIALIAVERGLITRRPPGR
ncbi:hypothetical protein SRB5_63490 [Streptomyces sp. RB5]|uniref:HTH luxR-type domain-containing protein n=1 Tax=Streptomyces smaragdinus TaxID=2585196 RepID=A0A7K0CRN7_9ACTN|nr:helix-turn-helix transcriptional regulator [Streptomyces smaragdinus]MQY16156.1 hypothetical protein [Streptomyces smaragdinus]